MARGCALIDSRPDTAKICSDGRVHVDHAQLPAVFGGEKTFSHGLGQNRHSNRCPATSGLPPTNGHRRADPAGPFGARNESRLFFIVSPCPRESGAPIMSAARLLFDQFKSRGGWIGKSPGHNATPRMLRDRNRSREKRLYGPDGRPSARVLIFRKRSGTISESARLVCGTDGG